MADNQNKGLSYLDMLTVLSVFLQFVTCQQVSNDTLLNELHRQDRYYLDKIMKDQKVSSKVLFLTATDNPDLLMKAVDMGCDGYILKKSDSTTLRKAIHSVYNGELYIEPELMPILNETVSVRDTAMDRLNDLTRREIDVLKLLAEGLFNKEIASRLNISERTVKNHVSNIFKKISVSDRTQAAVFAIKNNLIKISY